MFKKLINWARAKPPVSPARPVSSAPVSPAQRSAEVLLSPAAVRERFVDAAAHPVRPTEAEPAFLAEPPTPHEPSIPREPRVLFRV